MSYEEEDVFHVCGRANQTAASVCARRGLLLLSACMPACVCVCVCARARAARLPEHLWTPSPGLSIGVKKGRGGFLAEATY